MKMTKPFSPLSVPEGKSGEWAVVHETYPSGHKFQTANLRCRMFGGQKSKTVSWPHEVTVRKLQQNGGTWMSDLPCERAQCDAAIKGMRGRVLVGGLGLGYAATVLAARKSVTHVDVIEIEQDVIRLVAPYTRNAWHPTGRYRGWKIEVVHADLFDYLKNYDGRGGRMYDYAFFDIWTSDGEGTFFETVCPLYELSKGGKVKHPPVNWNEDVMRGQLASSLQSRLMWFTLTPEQEAHLGGANPYKSGKVAPPWEADGNVWHDWSVPFFKWWRETKPDAARLNDGVRLYAGTYGHWAHLGQWALFTMGVTL